MNQSNMTTARKLSILVVIICVIGTVFYFASRPKSSDPTTIYTDPNNGDQIAENYPGTPELPEGSKLTITGQSELIEQGVSSIAIEALWPLFTTFKKDITLASVVSKSVTQYRDNPDSGFNYSFDVQLDKGTYYKVVIATSDSTTGTITLYSKDSQTKLGSQDYSLTAGDSE